MTVLANPHLSEIESYIPGRAKIDGKKVIKLSSNENALGTSELAISAYKNYSKDLYRYADGSCAALRQAIGKKNEICDRCQ